MITQEVKRRVAIAVGLVGCAAWIAEMVYLGVAVMVLKAMFWP